MKPWLFALVCLFGYDYLCFMEMDRVVVFALLSTWFVKKGVEYGQSFRLGVRQKTGT
jgi:hypothetical protein